MTITSAEQDEIRTANESSKPVVVFVHGLWMLRSSWEPWRALFEAAGFATVAPGWPDDPETVALGRTDPTLFAGKRILDVTDHFQDVIDQLARRPAIVGHSFGGLITQQLAGRGSAVASVAIDAAPFRGVLPLPISALRCAAPVLRNPLNYRRSVSLTYEQFRYSFVNAVPEPEARELFETFPVPGSGRPLFQAATANINPATQARVNSKNPQRGPLLIITGSADRTAPPAIAKATYKRQRRNTHAPTEFQVIDGAGHSLVFDHGWPDVASLALDFIRRHGQ